MARILFFGKLGDLAGGREREFSLSGHVKTVGELARAIASEESLLGAALNEKSVRYIVNEKIAQAATTISEGDEIAFLPPVSGG